jgi:TonB family protein
MCPLPTSSSGPELVDSGSCVRPDLNRTLEQQVEAGFPPELALDLVLNELVVRAVDDTGASSAALALTRGDEMVCRAATGLHTPDLGVPLNTRDGLSGACLHTCQPQLCLDTESDPRVDPAIARRLGIRSMLIVPVLDQDDLIGVLEVFSSEPAAFSEHEQTLLEASARDCARIRHAVADLGRHPPAVLALSEEPPSLAETPPSTPAVALDGSAGARHAQPLYQSWTLILGSLAILAAVGLSFMAGSRLGWLFSSSPGVQVPIPASSPSQEDTPVAPPAASPGRPASPSRAVTSTAQSVPTPGGDELVVYDHGKVIFRMKPNPRKSGPSPVVDASESARIAPSPSAWLAPDLAELRLRQRIEPQYPADALAAHRSGEVLLEVLVAEDGSVASIRTLSGDPLLAAAAIDAVRQWRYEPYRRHERPSPFQTDVILKFARSSEN